MKNHIKLYLLAVLLLGFAACDEGFDELNVDKVSPTAVDPAFLLNSAIINTSHTNLVLVYEIGIVQQIISPNSGVLTGANYNQDNRLATAAHWQRIYRSVIRNTRDVIDRTQDLPERSNLLNMARILQAYNFLVLTDSYGDIPYFEGGKGYTEQISFPVYDAQATIYTDLIKELREAATALDASKRIETADVLYGGNIEKWKKFAYSTLLRIGMRLSKVDATQAQQVVQSAVQGGLMTSNADNAVVRHDANYTNQLGQWLNSTEANNFYLTEPFVNYLKSNDDPRLGAIAVRYIGAKSGSEQTADRASRNPDDQIGMPMGHDNNTIVGVATSKGLASFYEFSQADRTRVTKLAAPLFLVTYAQTQLLLAEAAHRNWTGGSAADYYAAGIRAHMEQMALHDANSAIAEDAIVAYLAAHPFDAGNALELINTQYWVASFLDGPEAFANFRRSGYPILTPNPFPGKDISGDFIRRLTYPDSEISVNSDNVQAAIGRQGPDNLETRVWWDK